MKKSELFGIVLATGDFRYTPDMFSPDSLLVNREIEMCYLDNTYFDRAAYSNIPSRMDALEQIKELIEIKKKTIPKEFPNTKVIFKIILKTLGKEELLIKLSELFDTKIVCSKIRYDRYTKVLELDEKYFSTNFEIDSFIFVQDNDNEIIDQIEGLGSVKNKHFIIIEPTALISDPNRPTNIRKLTEYYSKSVDTYFRVPYTDHSSYNEIVEFIRQLKPKRVLPIVRKMPNNIAIDDLSSLYRYLSRKQPIDTTNCYRFI
jgi:Cft2 family RNA processing exonuclease